MSSKKGTGLIQSYVMFYLFVALISFFTLYPLALGRKLGRLRGYVRALEEDIVKLEKQSATGNLRLAIENQIAFKRYNLEIQQELYANCKGSFPNRLLAPRLGHR